MPQIGASTVALLRRLGCEPHYRPEQTCCGQMHFNSGFRDEARRLARRFIEIFESDQAVVSPSGSCVHMVRNRYRELFADDPAWLRRAKGVAERTFELSQFIVDRLGVEEVGAVYEGEVAYHESCSLLYGLGVSEQPKRLIRGVKGARLVDLKAADICCGFGGKFSGAYPDVSEAMVADKAKNFLESGADCLVLCDPGCLLNIGGYLGRRHPEKKVLHLADFLAGHLDDRAGA